MGPRVLGLAAAQVNLVVVIFFASFVSDEAISAVNFAFLMMMLPVGVIGMAISTAAFPALAQRAAARDLEGLARSLDEALRVILFLAIPATVGLVLLAEPGVRLLLQRGAFDEGSSDLVVEALAVYALGVWALSAIEIVSRGFYALADTRTPVTLAVLAMLLNVALCAALVAPLGIAGLAAAASIAATVEFALLLRMLRGRLAGGFGGQVLVRSVRNALIATVVMAQVVIVLRLLLGAAGADASELLGAIVLLVFGGAGGVLAYLAAAGLLGSGEYRLLAARLGGSRPARAERRLLY